MPGGGARLTQRDIARLAGVSQATVSLVLNRRGDGSARIPQETRERVLEVIRATGYVADPAAQKLVGRRNQLLGVFTYEPVFPTLQADFYTPFLLGIEGAAERFGYDLLLFTSAPVTDGRRRIFHENNRLRLADGCILLGRTLDRDELGRLVASGYPFVAVGRRDDAGGPVPYVGADYAAATAALVRQAVALGHRRLAFIGPGCGAESSDDRWAGFRIAVEETGVGWIHEPAQDRDPGEIVDGLLREGATAALVEDQADAVVLERAARDRGVAVPGDLSLIALGNPTRPVATDIAFTCFRIPREEMGRQAVEILTLVMGGEEQGRQRLLPCELAEGQTLGPVPDRMPDKRKGRRN
ncbi:LacI family DNA-binding transcriptional regulator [Inquilinus sp. Marseille-Q2685]|uniref:LacI family DNA-binding transcriptional regulator n=1 Tax=Inquilinus sp. Marseille-Q2685 TaxID=2866581 RepID=UPI001CE3FD5F|nr:LacI family DNA-binding transcriptional regulator [Inquilinus sp. Marseille-Q2685]